MVKSQVLKLVLVESGVGGVWSGNVGRRTVAVSPHLKRGLDRDRRQPELIITLCGGLGYRVTTTYSRIALWYF